MISNLFKSFRLTIAFCFLFGLFYIFALWIFAQLTGPDKESAEQIELNGQIVGAVYIGQHFTQDIYFWGRPSHAGNGYDASASGASNKGPSDPEYLAVIETRIDSFLAHHPYLTRKEVPVEMVTGSSSGLDPHISPQSAYKQIKRVAEARGWPEEKVRTIVQSQIEKPFLGLFGPEKVNVLKLNIALEKAKRKNNL